jgi:phosphohistidine phosphatase
MKTLILIRHGKSARPAGVCDFDRPLNLRGRHDAPVMAGRLAALELNVDLLLPSPACRAFTTAEVFAEKLNLPVQTDERIYNAACADLLERVQSLDDRFNIVVLVGHNPGMTDLLNSLVEGPEQEMPTCSFTVIELPGWRDAAPGAGRLIYRTCPKGQSGF